MHSGFNCRAAAAILQSGRTLAHAGNTGALIAAFDLFASHGVAAVLLLVSLVFWLVQTYFAVRVAIDASLFRVLGEHPEDNTSAMDSLLTNWKLIKRANTRGLADRCHGALRLWKMQTRTFAVQVLLLLAALAIHLVKP